MAFLLACPNCGPREVHEFRHGGEIRSGATNLPGVQRERWFHRFGCRRWLVAERDVRTNAVLLTRFLPVGFYYKRFHKPRWLWPVFEHVVRHVAGLGTVDVTAVPGFRAGVEHLHAEVCVVGGGPAGQAAASAAAGAGADVLLLE